MASSASYASTPGLDMVQATAANSNRDGSGTLATLATGTASGKMIRRIKAAAGGATTAGVLRFFVSNDGGATKRLIHEELVPAITPSTSVAVWMAEIPQLSQLLLPNTNSILYVATHNAEAFNVFAENGQL